MDANDVGLCGCQPAICTPWASEANGETATIKEKSDNLIALDEALAIDGGAQGSFTVEGKSKSKD